MSRDPSTRFSTRLGRALRRQCPRCGAAAFESYFTLKAHCGACGLKFEREPGYWAGALIVNTAVIFATFVVTFGAGILITWPDVPWTGFLIVLVVINGLVPVFFYPQSKTVWSAMELGWNPLEPEEIEAAARRVE
jgi:uncharacterized protein (DUF983 family)